MSISKELSRREFIAVTATAAVGFGPLTRQTNQGLPAYGNGTIPAGIRSRFVSNVNGMTVHVLEAGFDRPGRPAVLLTHGFPELAYSWRKVMLPLADAGYHVIAPDQRGYGRTTGWDDSYDADPDPFRVLNMVRDAIGLVYALGHRTVAMVAGHDAGAPVASWAALIRPDIFRAVTILSSPFEGPPSVPFDTANGATPPPRAITDDELDVELAKLNPPRKYYQNYQRTRAANDNMLHAPPGTPRILPRLLSLQERRLERERAAPIKGSHRGRDGADPNLLRHAERQGHGRDCRAVHAFAGRDCRVQVADRA